jgi:hypothetical protein
MTQFKQFPGLKVHVVENHDEALAGLVWDIRKKLLGRRGSRWIAKAGIAEPGFRIGHADERSRPRSSG